MVVEQVVEVPATRRLVVEVPREIPLGRTILTFTPAPVPAVEGVETAPWPMTAQEALERGLGFGPGPRMAPREAIEKCRGIAKGSSFTSERLFEYRREDVELEEAEYRRNFHKDEGAD